jgi:ATP-binding protein involved in chromosome partitioning
MLQITEATVMDALRQVQEPELGGDLVTRNMIRDLRVDGAKVAFQIELTTPACPLKDEIETRVHAALDPIGVESVELTWGASVRRAAPRTAEQLLPGVKNVLAVASGKGGVGKSTVAVNLAVALARDGASVGLLDADITGPNVPLMLGLEGQPGKTEDNKIMPLVRHGVKAISIQFFVPAGQPIIWRGPLVGGAITQFLRDVDWGELDYLVIDLPPGTSDAQLTLAQAVPVSGAVLVTTPQEVSLLDVEKALAMFKRMSVPVLGLVENMTAFICPHCGESAGPDRLVARPRAGQPDRARLDVDDRPRDRGLHGHARSGALRRDRRAALRVVVDEDALAGVGPADVVDRLGRVDVAAPSVVGRA